MEKVGRLELVSEPLASRRAVELQDRTDDELMLLARGGLERAFDVLIRRHQARALRLAARFLAAPAQAPDAVQCAFVEIYRALPQFQARGKFKAYLYRVVLNQCRMVRRSARAELRAFQGADFQLETNDTELLARERSRDVEAAVAKLSEKLRIVVLLRYAADLSYDEIAATLEVPTGTVKRRLFDAMAKLRGLLEES